MKKCFKCGIEKELSEFYKHPNMPDGTVNKYKECNKKDVRDNREKNIDYYLEFDRNRFNQEERNRKNSERVKRKSEESEEYRLKILENRQKWLDNNQHKRKAQIAVGNALRDGKLDKPTCCEHCGTSEKKIQGHHWSYEPEHWLDVIWLCTSCHGKEHKRLNELGRDPDKQD